MNVRGMCDWEAGEYAEYLLWVEAEMARARAHPRPVREKTEVKAPTFVAIPPEAVEA